MKVAFLSIMNNFFKYYEKLVERAFPCFIFSCHVKFSPSHPFFREQSYMESVVTFLQDVVPQVSISVVLEIACLTLG